MSCYLYGVIESERAISFGPIGFEIGDRRRGLVVAMPDPSAKLPTAQTLAAVIGPVRQVNFDCLNKERLVRTLLAHQETMETIMRDQFILPCKFGTVLRDQQEARELLSQNGTLLAEWLDRMQDSYEMGVVASWDIHPILKEIAASDSEVMELKARLELLSLEEQERGKLPLGMLLSAKLKERAQRYAEDIVAGLEEVSESHATHDLINDEMVLNASFLLSRAGDDAFFRALEGLDNRWAGKLNLKCIGPLPPYSFATVTIKRFDLERIHRAYDTLGLKRHADVDQVKRAYRNMARQCHPDTHRGLDKGEFLGVHQAYELLVEYYEGGCKPTKVALSRVEEGNVEEHTSSQPVLV
ncbi:MAG: GvpL/GvpF family gas vesicle protein [Candidatus Eisenbacteria bacterium]|nr:GvpL/GvpF family gas vesicle protein [Candidatus Eisenbacteria bacterium]